MTGQKGQGLKKIFLLLAIFHPHLHDNPTPAVASHARVKAAGPVKSHLIWIGASVK
jgi:hypothetical protein